MRACPTIRIFRRFFPACLAALLLTVAAGPAAATDVEPAPWRPPQHRLFYKNLTVLRVNPLGLQNAFELGYRYRLFDSDSILLKDSFVGVAFQPTLTPAFARVGVAAQVQPLAVLFVEAKWQWIGWFGSFNHLQSFASPSADYSDTAIDDRGGKDLNYSTTGWELQLTAELRAKVGPVVIRDRITAMHTSMALKGGDRYYYEPLYDLLPADGGWMLTNDADVLVFLLEERLVVGARYSLGHTFYDDGVDNRNSPTHRVGPLVAYRFADEPGAKFDRPTALVMVQWYAKHRFRAGLDVNQAIPYVVVGFAFQGDLLDAR